MKLSDLFDKVMVVVNMGYNLSEIVDEVKAMEEAGSTSEEISDWLVETANDEVAAMNESLDLDDVA